MVAMVLLMWLICGCYGVAMLDAMRLLYGCYLVPLGFNLVSLKSLFDYIWFHLVDPLDPLKELHERHHHEKLG